MPRAHRTRVCSKGASMRSASPITCTSLCPGAKLLVPYATGNGYALYKQNPIPPAHSPIVREPTRHSDRHPHRYDDRARRGATRKRLCRDRGGGESFDSVACSGSRDAARPGSSRSRGGCANRRRIRGLETELGNPIIEAESTVADAATSRITAPSPPNHRRCEPRTREARA